MRVLIKLGGTLLDAEACRRRLASDIADLSRTGVQAVVVHGGGKQVTQFLAERNLETRFVNGLRVTTAEVLDAVLKVLAGSVNHELVGSLVAAGARAVGLSGMDALVAEAEQISEELGFVGRPVRSNPELLVLLVEAGYLPVISCVGGNRDGRFFNVNADQMATACAMGFQADKLLFLTDVDGVRGSTGEICRTLTVSECRELVESGVATGGMRAKLEAALYAMSEGIPEIVIAPGAAPGTITRLIQSEALGTRLLAGAEEMKT